MIALLSVGSTIPPHTLQQDQRLEEKVMNQYVTGAVIKKLREKNKMTHFKLAERLGVSDKTISKWET